MCYIYNAKLSIKYAFSRINKSATNANNRYENDFNRHMWHKFNARNLVDRRYYKHSNLAVYIHHFLFPSYFSEHTGQRRYISYQCQTRKVEFFRLRIDRLSKKRKFCAEFTEMRIYFSYRRLSIPDVCQLYIMLHYYF